MTLNFFFLQVAEGAIPQDQDLKAFKAFLQTKASLKPGQTLKDADYVQLLSMLKTGRTPEVIEGHVHFQSTFFANNKDKTFGDLCGEEMSMDWVLPFARPGGTKAQKLSLVNFLSGNDFKSIKDHDKERWKNIKTQSKWGEGGGKSEGTDEAEAEKAGQAVKLKRIASCESQVSGNTREMKRLKEESEKTDPKLLVAGVLPDMPPTL